MTRKMQYDEFLEKVKSIHGNTYTYVEDTFDGVGSKITIICNLHGEFKQKVGNHLYCKQGCPTCGIERAASKNRKTFDDFINAAKQKHDNFYDYSEFKYINFTTKGTIICPHHGQFKQSPELHVNFGNGCRKCGFERTGKSSKLSKDEIITRLITKFGDLYDISLVNTHLDHFPLPIICMKHGMFHMTYENFRLGQGCPYCSKKFCGKQNKWLDHLGIDRKLWQKRVYLYDESFIIADAFDPETNTIYEFWGDYHHGNPNVHSHDTIHFLSKKPLGELYENTLKKIEKIEKSGFNLIQIWENEWDKLQK
jgi:hypothetical protein